MRKADMQFQVIAEAVRGAPRLFHTRDISEHPAVVAAHRLSLHDFNYTSMIGREALSNHRGAWSIELVHLGTNDRGALWRRLGAE